jgi:hypothetical protein
LLVGWSLGMMLGFGIGYWLGLVSTVLGHVN